MSRFLIWSPPYLETSGGIICLHYLCHLLNQRGQEAWLVPDIDAVPFGLAGLRFRFRALKREWRKAFAPYATNPDFNTPVMQGAALFRWAKEDDIVVYPEITFGNPLMGRRVVRWLLHDPGYHTGQISLGPGELYFRYNGALRRTVHHPRSCLADLELRLVHYPLELYNLDGALDGAERQGTAYCLRKGRGKRIAHDLSDSILIDGLSHQEVSAVFKRVKRFISYDALTAYSKFAALCGCESIVVPDEDLISDEQRQFLLRQPGVSFGFDQLDWANASRPQLIEQIRREHDDNLGKVDRFVEACLAYFQGRTNSRGSP